METEELVRAGRLAEAIEQLQQQIRSKPADAKLRVFLFQLLSVLGQWPRAMTQLNVAAEMDLSNLLMAQVCRAALNCEVLRAEIFTGKRSPLVFGEPDEWVVWMIQANQLSADGQDKAAGELRQRAFEAAPAVPGTINTKPFQWLADGDQRLGPILEAIIDGTYYWVPMCRIRQLDIEPPTDLRDLVWLPASFTWSNGGQAVGLIPVRYPGSPAADDATILLGRRTEWQERGGGLVVGLGQRMLATDDGEYPLLETRRITMGLPATEAANA